MWDWPEMIKENYFLGEGVQKKEKKKNKIKYSEVSIAWVPSHVGLAGNDKADSVAKDGLKREEANSTEYLEGKEMNSLIRDEILKRWHTEYDLETKGLFFKNIESRVSTAIKYLDFPRKREVQISRLRFGHVLSKSWLKTMKKCESNLCSVCQEPETIEHIYLNAKPQYIGREGCSSRQHGRHEGR